MLKQLGVAALTFGVSLSAIAAPSASRTSAWDGWNNPYKMDANFENRLSEMPLTGELSSGGYAWPESYWPNNKGSIAQRWTSKNPQHFKYDSPSMYEAQNMTAAEINQLSPAEKYDLYVGSYDYPTVSKLWSMTRKGEAIWHGICHGVAPASIHHKEPQAVTVTSADGITITFYASDVKGLLAHHYAKESDTGIIQVGKRCFVGGRFPIANRSSGCTDVNAGSFHMIVANKLGLSKTGYLADLDRYKQVWNHAAVSYESTVLANVRLASNSTDSATKRVKVKTVVKYAASIDASMTAVIGTKLEKYDTRKYAYYLDLNSKGEIVGGEWISKERPDFMWYKEKDEFTGYWEKLITEIYKANQK